MSRQLGAIVADHLAWTRKTFPDQTPESVMGHLQRELEELAANPYDGEEQADCVMLLLALADRTGVDPAAELEQKLEINKARRWEIVEGGHYEHVRDGEEDAP